MARCSNCGVELRPIRVTAEDLKPPDTGFRLAHPSKDFKAACDLLAKRRKEATYRVAGQMFYDPVMQQYMWRPLNG